MVLAELADRASASFKSHKANAAVAEGRTGTDAPRLILAKPNSYMNLSGGPVAALLRFYKLEPSQLIVVHDELDIDGKVTLALVKDVQKDPVRQIIEHIDLIVIRKGEKVTVDVSIHLEGESAPGTLVNQDANTISLEAEATHIPESITVSIEGAEDGFHVYAKDLELPSGSSLISDGDTLIVAVSTAAEQDLGDEPEAAADEAATEAPAEDAE